VIAGVIDTSDKFIASDNVMGEQLSAVSLTVVINLSLITMIPVIHNCSLHGIHLTRGLFYLQSRKPHDKNKDAIVEGDNTDTAANCVI